MRAARRCTAFAGAAALTALLLAPGAHADSLVYMTGGNVWIAHGDGSGARQVTGGPNTWSWPSMDSTGTIVVAGGAGGTRDGVEDTPGSEVYRLSQQGAGLSTPQQTPGSLSTPSALAYPPQNLRVAPDGKHFAYHAFVGDRFITEIGTVGGQGFSGSEYMSDFVYPYWVDNSDFVMSRGGVPLIDSDGEWWVHAVGDQANYGYNWFGDPATYAGDPGGWATGYDGIAVSSDGSKVAAVEEDAANWSDGAARKVVLRLWSAGGAPTPAKQDVPAPVFECEVALPPDPDATAWFDNAGPTFSPDGTRLVFAEPDGVHIADVSDLADCPTVQKAPLVIPGATQPFWSTADEAANAGYAAPVADGGGSTPPPTGGSGGTSGSGSGPTTAPATTAPDTTAPVIAALSLRPTRFAVAKRATALVARKRAHKGTTARYTLSEPAEVTFAVRRATSGRRVGKRCVKPTKRLRHARPCTRLRTVGSLVRFGSSGANQFGFTGRLGKRKLPAGRYQLQARAADAAGNRSAKRTVGFTIVRR